MSYYAGMEVEAQCGRCRLETTHRIFSITAGVPEKLICGRCNSIHKFRPVQMAHGNKAVLKTEPSRKTTRTAARAASVSPKRFQNLMAEESPGANAKPYGKGIAWETGMWMDHPNFGLGKIQRRTGRKVDVLFHSGLKTLLAI